MNKKVIYAALMFVVTMSSGNASAQQLPYQNPALSAYERAVDLCGRLTLEEKASLMLDPMGKKGDYTLPSTLSGIGD